MTLDSPTEGVREAEGRLARAWVWAQRNLLSRSLVRTALGLMVLAAIVGGLFAIDRTMGGSGELGALDGRRPEVGEPAPEFALREPGGAVRQLSDYDGKPVWINFWATWCGPCRRELPDIERLAAEFEDEGLVVLTVNQEQSASDAEAFWEELGLELPILLDSDGAVSEQYRLVGLPNNFFIDEDGVLRAFNLGFLTEGQMRESLAEVGLGPPLLEGD